MSFNPWDGGGNQYSSIVHYGFPNTATNNSGYRQCCLETIENIDHNGMLELKGTTVRQHLKLNGTLNAQQAILNKVNVNGAVDLKETTVAGPCEVKGKVYSLRSSFQNLLSVFSHSIVLEASTCESISVKKGSDDKPTEITLKNQTTVNGDIAFEMGNGKVYVDASSTIKGSVRGGVVHRL